MRLLDKQEIDKAKALEKKKEVDEGMKLAKTVDHLRRVKSEEESNIRKFRDQSLSTVQSEVDVLIEKKNATQAEITAMEAKRIELERPVDLTNEWKEVRQLKEVLLDRETHLISREALVQDLEKREKELAKKEVEAQRYFDEARSSYTKVDNLRNDMENRKEQVELHIQTQLKALDVEEKDLANREIIIAEQIKQINVDKKDILDKGTSLIERESKNQLENKLLFERDEALKEKEILTKRYNDEASRNYSESENVKIEIKRLLEESQKAIHTRYVELADKEKDFGYKERDLISQREHLEKDRKELETEKLHVASQQTALRQAWQNIKSLQK